MFILLDEALKDIHESLKHDGYELKYNNEEGVINIFITAGPGACAECLVPESVIKQMVAKKISEKGILYKQIKIHMP